MVNSNALLKDAQALFRAGQLAEAAGLCQQAMRQDPNNYQVYLQLGTIMANAGKLPLAVQCLEKARMFRPESTAVAINLGNVKHALGQYREAEALHREVVARKPELATGWYNLGITLKEQKKLTEAMEVFKKAVALDSNHVQALEELCPLLTVMGPESAKPYYEKLVTLNPSAEHRISYATLLPTFLPDGETLKQVNAQFKQQVNMLLADETLTEDPAFTRNYLKQFMSIFYLPYHAMEHREVMEKYARIFEKVLPQLRTTAPHCQHYTLPQDRPLKIGVLSRHFGDSVISYCFNGILKGLAQEQDMELILMTTNPAGERPELKDSMYREMAARAKGEIWLPPDILRAQQMIADQQCDILLYTDVIMDHLAYFLGFARLAPLQVLLPGMPITGGLPEID
ncbi:MAG: tetratricopeptide repeat protein, partial [Rickettsiales bacterium]|nr:tetratricopeptide repeat protein [Rickettsiales bacterium]